MYITPHIHEQRREGLLEWDIKVTKTRSFQSIFSRLSACAGTIWPPLHRLCTTTAAEASPAHILTLSMRSTPPEDHHPSKH